MYPLLSLSQLLQPGISNRLARTDGWLTTLSSRGLGHLPKSVQWVSLPLSVSAPPPPIDQLTNCSSYLLMFVRRWADVFQFAVVGEDSWVERLMCGGIAHQVIANFVHC